MPGYEGDAKSVRRAFERDKEALRNMGIPIDVDLLDPAYPDDGQVYRIRREAYALPDPGLDADELAALHLAVTTVALEGEPGTEAIWKLGGATGEAAEVTVAALPGDEHLPALFQAANESRTVTFGYKGAIRTVDPYRLAFRKGRWLLAGFDHDRDDERSFRLDRIDEPPSVATGRGLRTPSGDRPPGHEPTVADGRRGPDRRRGRSSTRTTRPRRRPR